MPFLFVLTICILLELICNPCGTGPFLGGTVFVSLFGFFIFTSASYTPTPIARLCAMTWAITFTTHTHPFFFVINPIAPFAPFMPKLALQAMYKRCL